MATIILLLDFVLIWVYLFIKKIKLDENNFSLEKLFSCFFKASLVWCLFLLFFTEILSLFNALTFGGVIISWTLVLIILILLIFRNRISFHEISNCLHQIKKRKFGTFEVIVLLFLAFLFFSTLFLALYYPPNNWDSMTYHLSRIFFWIQNKNIGFYATNNERQLIYQPFAEFIILHLKLLSKSNIFSCTVQWFGYVGSILGVYLISRELGADKKARLASVIIAATLPIAILQSLTTQNDLVNSYFILISIYFILRLVKQFNLADLLFLCIAVGLAILTKGSSYVFIGCFLVFYGIRELFRKNIKSTIIAAGFLIIVPLLMNSGYFYRNYVDSGQPLGNAQKEQVNEIFTCSALISNLSKNLYLHLTTPVQPWNNMVKGLLLNLHGKLGLDVNDKRLNYLQTKINAVPDTFSYQEDTAQNFFHLLLILVSIVTGIIYFIYRRSEYVFLILYILCLVLTFIVFCFIFKWQPWHTRIHMPLFLLFAPVCGIIISRSSKILYSILLILIFFAIPCIFLNDSHPFPLNYRVKMNQYDKIFINYPQIKESYKKTIDLVNLNHFKMIGLQLGGDDWDYPLCYFLQEKNKSNVYLTHVMVYNSSKKYEKADFHPDCIISSICKDNVLVYNDSQYKIALTTNRINVYVKNK
jgi:hypothetical protein